MDPNYKVLLQTDSQFTDCYLAATDHASFNRTVGIAGAQNVDVYKLCKAIWNLHRNNPYSSKNLSNGKSYRFLWFVTSQLLLGTTSIFNMQVKSIFDEANKLIKSLTSSYYFIENTQTIKRKTDEVIDKRGSKRKRTQIEVENYQRIAFWEDEDVSDAENEEDFEAAWDQNVTDNHNITLREDVYSDLRDEDEDMELPSFSDDEFDNLKSCVLSRQPRNSVNRGANNVSNEPESDGNSSTRAQASTTVYNSLGMENLTIDEPTDKNGNEVINDMVSHDASLNANDTGMQLDANEVLHEAESDPGHDVEESEEEQLEDQQQKRKRKKPKRPIFDSETELRDTIFERRLSNPFVGCNQRLTNADFEANLHKQKDWKIFRTPIIRNQSEIVALFSRNLRTCEKDDDVTNIYRLILNMSIGENEIGNESDANDNNNTRGQINNTSIANEILDEVLPRRSSRQKKLSKRNPVIGADGIENESEAKDTNGIVRSQTNNASFANEIQDEILPRRSGRQKESSKRVSVIRKPIIENEEIQEHQPIPEEVPDILLPPIEFDQNNNNNGNYERNLNDTNSMQANASDLDEDRDIIDYVLKSTPDESGFSSGANELSVLKLLTKLWKQTVYPIGMDKINKIGESRLRAAKNFASLLVLEKRQFIRVENTDNRQIYHIAEGIALNRN